MTEKELCRCLYETIIQESSECVFENVNTDRINYVNKLKKLVFDNYEDDYIDDQYERLVVFGVGSINYGGDEYFRVIRTIGGYDTFDYSKNKDITIWSNAKMDIDNQFYIIYYKGEFVGTLDCPPIPDDVKSLFINTKHPLGDLFDMFTHLFSKAIDFTEALLMNYHVKKL